MEHAETLEHTHTHTRSSALILESMQLSDTFYTLMQVFFPLQLVYVIKKCFQGNGDLVLGIWLDNLFSNNSVPFPSPSPHHPHLNSASELS